jgi:hypothetical protein
LVSVTQQTDSYNHHILFILHKCRRVDCTGFTCQNTLVVSVFYRDTESCKKRRPWVVIH